MTKHHRQLKRGEHSAVNNCYIIAQTLSTLLDPGVPCPPLCVLVSFLHAIAFVSLTSLYETRSCQIRSSSRSRAASLSSV